LEGGDVNLEWSLRLTSVIVLREALGGRDKVVSVGKDIFDYWLKQVFQKCSHEIYFLLDF